MLIPATLAKNSLGADGKIGIAFCPVARAKSPSFTRKTFSGSLSESRQVPTYSSRAAMARTMALYAGASGALASSVAKPKSSTSTAVLARITTPPVGGETEKALVAD